MDQRRFILFILLSTLIIFGWSTFVLPRMFPNAVPQPGAQQQGAGPEAPAKEQPAEPQPPVADKPEAQAAPEAADALPNFPHREIVLGSDRPDSEYFLQLRVTSTGAAIESALLNDERYCQQDNRAAQLLVVGNNPAAEMRTLEMRIPRFDARLPDGATLATVDWEVAEQTESSVTFRYPAPGGELELRKTFTLHKGDPAKRDVETNGYVVDVKLEFASRAAAPLPVQYELIGPVGVPLENADNTSTFIQIKVGTAADPGDPVVLTAGDVAKQVQKANQGGAALDRWRDPLQYIGVDVQYFAALLVPREDQTADPDGDGQTGYLAESEPVLRAEDNKHPERSDVTVRLRSHEFHVAPGAEVAHEFAVFLGPKRSSLLEPLKADGVISFGWFGRISVGMVYLLNFFHSALYLPYAFAIVLLTLMVRACMFPITRKQAAGAKKMKELQPKLQEIKTKYAKEPEKFWQAQRDLFRKHNYHPLAGCLPLFLQLPIFIGLYSALANAVDLRMERFLWINDLTAPDALFGLPFTIPFLGNDFNLLPLITIALWIVQQKMFMPPALSEEQELQQKMMNYMMIFIGFMIYKVPAGLCVYFITSTLWGIGERKLVDRFQPAEKKSDEALPETRPATDDAPAEPRRPGLLERLLAAADQAREQTNGRSGSAGPAPKDDKRSGKRRARHR
jgi:YidC/Oxa1 family membrane protein insertase